MWFLLLLRLALASRRPSLVTPGPNPNDLFARGELLARVWRIGRDRTRVNPSEARTLSPSSRTAAHPRAAKMFQKKLDMILSSRPLRDLVAAGVSPLTLKTPAKFDRSTRRARRGNYLGWLVRRAATHPLGGLLDPLPPSSNRSGFALFACFC